MKLRLIVEKKGLTFGCSLLPSPANVTSCHCSPGVLNNKAQSSKTCCAFYVLKRNEVTLDRGEEGIRTLDLLTASQAL